MGVENLTGPQEGVRIPPQRQLREGDVTKTNFRKRAPGDLRMWPLGGPGILSKCRHVWYGPEIKRKCCGHLKLVPFRARGARPMTGADFDREDVRLRS